MSEQVDAYDYKIYRHTVMLENEGYTVRTTRLDGLPLTAGKGRNQEFWTMSYSDRESAIAAAKRDIDLGLVR